MNGYPVQIAKVQPPPLRTETLARERLLDWLGLKIHHRVVLIVAEAGYGKTTLLADFSRRTRTRMLWYRLDEADRGWVPFLSHLVAAGREHDPGFAPATNDLLHELGASEPPRQVVLESFLRELPAITGGGAALILDDFHLVDDAEDVRDIVRDLVLRAPERMSVVISSRRQPGLPIARLRAQGEVAELSTDDLRFDRAETERLFREAYGQPLEQDVLADLSNRTEGWAASLQLVNAALRGRSSASARSFIHTLSGAEGELYDYLAEEVVADLRPEMQHFLMRSSILETVEADLAALVADTDRLAARRLIDETERTGLLSRRGGSTRGGARYHPLVRDFLEERLARDLGHDGVARLHLLVAEQAGQNDWQLACRHYLAAGAIDEAQRVLEGALHRIMATGQYVAAANYIDKFSLRSLNAATRVILSRAMFSQGEMSAALDEARHALDSNHSSEPALANLASLLISTKRADEATSIAKRVMATGQDPELREIAMATIATLEVSVDGDLISSAHQLRDLAARSQRRGNRHYEAVSHLNAAYLLRGVGDAAGALVEAAEALGRLDVTFTDETAAAHCVRGWALAYQGEIGEARSALAEARLAAGANPETLRESLIEFACTETWLGDEGLASQLLREARGLPVESVTLGADTLELVSAQLSLRLNDRDHAALSLAALRPRLLSSLPGRETWRQSLEAHLALSRDDDAKSGLIDVALAHAQLQRSRLWTAYNQLLAAMSMPADQFDRSIAIVADQDSTPLSMLAELIVGRLAELREITLGAVRAEAVRKPERWRRALREAVDTQRHPARLPAARILDAMGTKEDIGRLRSAIRVSRMAGADGLLGRSLARRLADHVFVEDQGRVTIRVGDLEIRGTQIRRKVLALLCYLLSRSRFSATRDEVLDALWPDADPAVALNSLNQTIYFLRRVFEPAYQEDTTPEYLHHDGEVVWLDTDLIDARSARCRVILENAARPPSPNDIAQLTDEYRGRFALDFAYEDWATEYRDTLHAAYLFAIEGAVQADMESGHFARAVAVASAALRVDPEATQLELSILRLYRMSGAHAAAAEQYAHYAASIRGDLGVEPPPLDSI